MDDGAYYKAKEELADFCTAYIDKKFESEKGLIKDYIGLGLRVAVVGLGIAVVTAGFFGWKSYDDVNKAALAEINSRLDKDNPVVKYDRMIKEVAIDGVVSSLTAQINQGDRFLSDDDINFLVRALQEDGITVDKKSEILSFAATVPFSETKAQFARAARKLIQADFKDYRESGIALMRSLIRLYISDRPNAYVTDALNIMENYKDEDVIAQSVSAMLDQLDPQDASRILKKVESRTDEISKFHIQMFNLRTNPQATLDEPFLTSVFQNALEFSFGQERISLTDIFNATSALGSDNTQLWQVCALFAKQAIAKDYWMEYRFRDQDRFGEGERKPGLALATKGASFGLPIKLYGQFLSEVSKIFLVRSSWFTTPDVEDLSTMSFWMPKISGRLPNKAPQNSDYKTYFLYQGGGEIKGDTGEKIADGRVSGRLAIAIEAVNGAPTLNLFWRDRTGVLQKSSSSKITGINKGEVSMAGLSASYSIDDDL
jgi:hypothetical protein